MRFILDTDHLSILDRGSGAEAMRLRARLSVLPPDDVAATIISFEEQTRGWFAVVARARTLPRQIDSYARLSRHLDLWRGIPTLPFDDAAAVEFQRIQGVRVGTMDLRIASIALSRGLTLLTRNAIDFRQIPGLVFEDWTV